MIKIHGEHTRPTDAPTLCETCRAATVVRGARFADDFVKCAATDPAMFIRFTVAECSDYSDKRVPTRYDLMEIGWVWAPDVDRFLSPNERMRQQAGIVATTAPGPPGFWARLRAVFVPQNGED